MTFNDAIKQTNLMKRTFDVYGAFKASLKKSSAYFLTWRRMVKAFCEDFVKNRNI